VQTQRATDSLPRRHFRSDRISAVNGQYYFATREGTLEGPYFSRSSAEQEAAAYIDRIQHAKDIIRGSWEQLF
jgi:hypothetical protein